jgi:endonuclease/exonuclease/phosphatase family metal-dependent hydrolase
MSFNVVVWNMAHKVMNWPELSRLDADVALLNEATAAPDGLNAVGSLETHGRDKSQRRWGTRVVSTHPIEEIADATASRYGRRLNIPFENARPGSWTAATVALPGLSLTVVALYGLLDEKSDASVHRSLSELTPLFEDKRYSKHLLLGGDLNTWTGWKEGSRHLARDRNVLDRIRALGFEDCLERGSDREGPLSGCPCSLGEECRHFWTRRDPRNPDTPYQMDYLFASRALAERLERCEALPPPEWHTRSDHSPIVATFSG